MSKAQKGFLLFPVVKFMNMKPQVPDKWKMVNMISANEVINIMIHFDLLELCRSLKRFFLIFPMGKFMHIKPQVPDLWNILCMKPWSLPQQSLLIMMIHVSTGAMSGLRSFFPYFQWVKMKPQVPDMRKMFYEWIHDFCQSSHQYYNTLDLLQLCLRIK